MPSSGGPAGAGGLHLAGDQVLTIARLDAEHAYRDLQPWDTDSYSLSSPDRRYVYQFAHSDSRDSDSLVGRRARRAIKGWICLKYPVWPTSQAVAGIVDDSGESPGICVVGIDGTIRSRALFRPSHASTSDPVVPPGVAVRRLQTIPGDVNHVVWWSDGSSSTVRPFWNFYLVDVRTGRAVPMRNGQFVIWSPDGKRYACADRRLVPYGKHRDGSPLVVWETPLLIVSAGTGKARSITPGRVWVDGADWRTPRPWPGGRLVSAREY